MASSSWCLYAAAAAASLSRCSPLPSPTRPPSVCRCICILLPRPTLPRGSRVRRNAVVCMAPEEEKMTRRSPLDFPIGSFPYIGLRSLLENGGYWWKKNATKVWLVGYTGFTSLAGDPIYSHNLVQ
ncbi:unnamed protein product [Musa acuminata subsp. burmannicoides]